MEDIARQKGTALEALTLGMDTSTATELYGIDTASLDYSTNVYDEQRRQMDKIWGQIGTVGTS